MFSVFPKLKYLIQLAFRACHALRDRKIAEVRRILCATGMTQTIDRSVQDHLRDTADAFPTGDIERQVANQVTLKHTIPKKSFDYKSISNQGPRYPPRISLPGKLPASAQLHQRLRSTRLENGQSHGSLLSGPGLYAGRNECGQTR